MNGIILVHKGMHFTSHDVVAKLRRILNMKKIGHTGTLDPCATGLLPVCLGSATKVCDLLTGKEKEYIAGIRFGVVTDTQDSYGLVLEERPSKVTKEQFLDALLGFLGEQEQLTPMFSARKVNGQKLVDLARAGKTVERSTKRVTFFALELLSFEEEKQEATIRVVCSAGTYVRTLCHDLGQVLGCGACMCSLLRTGVKPFTLSQAHTLEEIAEAMETGRIASYLIPADSLFPDYEKAEVCTEEGRKRILNGNLLLASHLSPSPKGTVRVYLDGQFIAIYSYAGKGTYQPVKMFLS